MVNIPLFTAVYYMSGGAGFLPSTVSLLHRSKKSKTFVNEFGFTTCDRDMPPKMSPILGSKSLLRWTLLLGVPPTEGGKDMVFVNNVRGQRWIWMFRQMNNAILREYIYIYLNIIQTNKYIYRCICIPNHWIYIYILKRHCVEWQYWILNTQVISVWTAVLPCQSWRR